MTNDYTELERTEPHTLITSIRSYEYDLGYIPLDMSSWEYTDMLDYFNWMSA